MEGTLLDLLEKRVALGADQPLYSFLDRQLMICSSLTCQALYDRARKFAGTLQKQGCEASPVLVYCPHGTDFVIAFFACVLAGAWPVPVARHRAQSGAGLVALVRACGATTVITTSARVRSLPEALTEPTMRVLPVDRPTDDCHHYRRPILAASDIAFIQYTSGSTAAPKGVVISHGNVMSNVEQIRRAFRCTPDDVGVSWLPFYHDMGLIGHVIQPMYAGIHNHFLNPLDFMARPVRWLQAISTVGGTLSGGPDFAFSLAMEKVTDHELATLKLSQWRLAYCGAEKIRPQTLKRFAKKFAPAGFNQNSLYPCYGLAESTLFVSGQHGVLTHSVPVSGRHQHTVCLGQPAPGTTVIVVDPVRGHRVAEGDVGEVCIHSPSVARRYFSDRIASSRTFSSIVDAGMFFCRTGDRGFLHEQRLYLMGRYKNLIKRRGCSYHAEDMEAAVLAGLDARRVARCAAFSAYNDGSDILVVLLEQTRQREFDIDSSEHVLIDKTRALLVDQFGIVPDSVRLLPANTLPLTSSGKIKRGACCELYHQQNISDGGSHVS